MTIPKILSLLLIGLLSSCKSVIPPDLVNHSADNTAGNPILPIDPAEERLCRVTAKQLDQFDPPDYDNLWDRLRAGYQLPQGEHPRIDTHFEWYANNPRYMERVSERADRYLFHIVEQLEAQEMPLELALLPIVESAFDPFAYSHGRASGIWQFIPATGKNFGLKQNWWYDGRRDIEASTEAALRYLSYLHQRFDGDWLLALAAYNTGEGNVSRAITKNQRAGKPTDFWSLSLPKETRAYVPQLLALSKLIADPEPHQVALHPIPNQPHFERVDIGSQIDLAQAAELAQLDIDELYLLNAGYNRWATDPKGPHHLLLPVDKAAPFRQKLSEIPSDERIGWERYRIKAGDSLISLAKRFNTSVKALKQSNNLRGNTIRQGRTLLIPVATKPANHYAFSAEQRLERKQARARGKSGSKRIEYRVQPGDSLWKIARRHDVRVASLARWNGMAPKDVLKPGQKLVIWTNNKQLARASTSPGNSKGIIRKVAYHVRQGDSLARIAGKFNLSVKDILKWNPVKRNSYIHPGQLLTLFVDVTRVN